MTVEDLPQAHELQQTREVVLRDTLHPLRVRVLNKIDVIALTIGITSALLDNAIRESDFFQRPWEFGALSFLAMCSLVGTLWLRYRWSLARRSLLRHRRGAYVIAGLWLFGLLVVIILGPIFPGWKSGAMNRWHGFVNLAELALVGQTLVVVVNVLRGATAAAFNPALILVASFFGVIVLGTALLLLPRARVGPGPPESAPFVTALFTATSATCVTGLIVEDTPTYWSRDGQCVILVLFQMGGLGIMTFGSLFGLFAGRSTQLREHATLGSLLESEGLGDVRRLLLAIVGFTLFAEGLGAVLLFTLWPELPLGERLFVSVFHAISAFCNAGFALTPDSFVGMAHRWQVWGVVPALIIIGGLGFAVLNDLVRTGARWLQHKQLTPTLFRDRPRVRITLTSRLVLTTTVLLLVGGTLAIFLLERAATHSQRPPLPLADAWFQSVTFRTAGFNTVDLGQLHPSTKLVGVLLMFIGASPGSTGGGIRTVVFAIAVLGMLSLLRGRDRVECFGRTLPPVLVQRAMAVMFLSLGTVMAATILLMLYEDHSAYFLDYLFEAVSAVGTVGVSSTLLTGEGTVSSVTQSLSTPSRLVLVVAMFLGRVGPLTLLFALGGRTTTARYQYPEERVILG